MDQDFFSYYLDDEFRHRPMLYVTLAARKNDRFFDGSSVLLRRDGTWSPPNAEVIARQLKGAFDSSCLLYEEEAIEIAAKYGGDLEVAYKSLIDEYKKGRGHPPNLVDGTKFTAERIVPPDDRFINTEEYRKIANV